MHEINVHIFVAVVLDVFLVVLDLLLLCLFLFCECCCRCWQLLLLNLYICGVQLYSNTSCHYRSISIYYYGCAAGRSRTWGGAILL